MNNKGITNLLAFFVITGMLIFPQKTVLSGYDSLIFCGKVIIPTLLPFFICIKILTKTGLSEKLGDKLAFLMRPLFNVPGTAAFPFVMGLISGFPMGAKCTTEIFNNNGCTKKEAERMLCFCNNASPIFVIGTVGLLILGSIRAGLILYISHFLSAITIGIIFGLKKENEGLNFPNLPTAKKESEILSSSVAEGINLILYVCGFIIFFNVFVTVIDCLGVLNPLPEKIKYLILGCLEMTKGIPKIAAHYGNFKLPVISFILGFSGLCVIMQISGIVEKYQLNIKKFVFAKFLQGSFSFLYTCIFICMPISLPVFSPVPYPLSFWGSIVVCTAFVIVSFLAFVTVEIIVEIIRFAIYKLS